MYYLVVYFKKNNIVVEVTSSLKEAGEVIDKVKNARIIKIEKFDDYISVRPFLL